MKTPLTLTAALAAAATLTLAGCGGGGDGGSTAPGDGGTAQPSLAQRSAAAATTASSITNDCATLGPFYWEVGNAQGAIASGSVTRIANPTVYTANTAMNIASASKWLYAAYVIQREPVPSDETIKYLTFRSGYSHFNWCLQGQTVQQCEDMLDNDVHDDANDGKFYYGGGHMQKHATLIGLGALDNAGLAAELRSQLGSDIMLSYSQPQPAGGVVSTAADYARFLRKLLDGSLKLGSMLGSHAVCTNPGTCADAVYTPIPNESVHYSLGHWVEDDPVVGDGAFSSAGAFGFYPWIDAQRSTYGVIARDVVHEGEGYDSALCGRRIRKAFATGVAQ
jgi:hypothetical protein